MDIHEMTAVVYSTRNDHEPGYVYLMEAENYHGLIPGTWLRRCKIGLSRNPEARLDRFHRNQPPCNVKILKTIYVEDMAKIESQLHNKFNHCSVNLMKSTECFDFNPVQFLSVHWAFEKEKLYVFTINELPLRLIILSLIGVFGAGIIVGILTSNSLSKSVNSSVTGQTIYK